MARLRVIQWGTGYAGVFALRYILGNSNLDLVGVKCNLPSKDGRDAGELAGVGPKGVFATRDGSKLLSLDADCVVFMPRDFLADPSIPGSSSKEWVDELIAILESGKNVITPLCAGTHWKHMARGKEFRDRLNAACQKGGVTVHFSGFDPGFTTDALAFTLASVVGEIEQIRTWEIIDVDTYTAVLTLQQLGFGARPQDLPAEGAQVILSGWSGALHLLGEALGVTVEDVKLAFDIDLAATEYTTRGGLPINKGTISAIRWTLTGIVASRPRFIINHITRAGRTAGANWENIGTDGGYRVEIDGFPPFRGDFPMGLPGGTGSSFTDAMAMTAARCVNSIEAVVRAPSGYQTFLSLPPLGGRNALLP